MVEGTRFHNELAKAYDFLGLYGYNKCHIYHYFEEEKGCNDLLHYYHTHYFKLLQIENIPQQEIIPTTWFKYTSQDVDINTRRSAIKDIIIKWINWEESTKKLYQSMYFELTNISEISAALELEKYIKNVSKELSDAHKKLIELEAINYDMPTIMEWQSKLCNKYKKKIKNIF